MLGTYYLNSLFEILNKIHFIHEPPAMWRYVLEESCKVLQAESGSFFSIDEAANELRLEAVHGVDEAKLSKLPFKVGIGICGWVAQYQQPAMVPDVRVDNRFNRSVDQHTGFKTRSIVCVPVFTANHRFGVFEIFNRSNGQFNPQDQEFMTLLGRQTAVAYQNVVFVEDLRQSEAWLESLMASLTGGLIAVDTAGKIIVFNPAATTLLQLPANGYIGKPANVILIDYPWIQDTLKDILANPVARSRQETLLKVAGQDVRFGYSTIPILDAKKAPLGAGLIFQKLS